MVQYRSKYYKDEDGQDINIDKEKGEKIRAGSQQSNS